MYHQLFSHQLFDLLAFYFADLLLPRLFGFRTQVLEHPTLKALVSGSAGLEAFSLGTFAKGHSFCERLSQGLLSYGLLTKAHFVLERFTFEVFDLEAFDLKISDLKLLASRGFVLPQPFEPA